MEFVSGKKTTELLGVHQQTLYQWEDKGWISATRTPGGKRMYNVREYLERKGLRYNQETKKIEPLEMKEIRKKICYCRVSSHGQKDDLERQVEYMKDIYPDYDLIKDVGSGLNFKRKGLLRIMDMAIRGEIEELVIAYKDRLARFGYDFLEYQIKKYSQGKITVINDENETVEEELTKDLLQIMNVFVAKMNGMRKYSKNKGKKKKNKRKINKGK